jgi:hypothetical protein
MPIFWVGCTATFNWREVRSDEQGFVALFPDKTKTEKKQLSFKDQEVSVVMQASMTGGALFAISSLKLDQSKVTSQEMVQLLQTNARKSLKLSTEPELVTEQFTIAGESTQKITGQGYRLLGQAQDHQYRVFWVYWLTRPAEGAITRIYQLTAIKSFAKEPTSRELEEISEQFTTFIAGFKPY